MSLHRLAQATAEEIRTNGKASPQKEVEEVKPKKGALILPDYFFQAPRNQWWARDANSVFTEYPLSHIRGLLLQGGLRGSVVEGERVSPADAHLIALRQEKNVQWAGELAGFAQGVHEIQGTKILVTRGPKLIRAAKGTFPTLQKLLSELLSDQLDYFYAWLKSSLRSLYKGYPFRPGQAMAIAGKSGCGKSLLQGLLTELLGGRSGKPYQYLMGETGFNEDLLSREHLMLEDEASSTDIRKRIFFGTQLKNMIANDVIRCHPKGTKGIYLSAFWRVSITLNDEPENLMVLPPITDDLKDKIILLKASPASFPFGQDNLRARDEYRCKLSTELPAFVNFLQGWRIPPRLCNQRYGCSAWQNPDLMEILHRTQPEFRLLELIEYLKIWGLDNEPWTGNATELENVLLEKDKSGRVRDLLKFHSACGTYLGKLTKHFPQRIKRQRGEDNKAHWWIGVK